MHRKCFVWLAIVCQAAYITSVIIAHYNIFHQLWLSFEYFFKIGPQRSPSSRYNAQYESSLYKSYKQFFYFHIRTVVPVRGRTKSPVIVKNKTAKSSSS